MFFCEFEVLEVDLQRETVSCTQLLSVSLFRALTESPGFSTTEKNKISELLGEMPGAADCSCNPTNPLKEKTGKGRGLNLEGPQTRRRFLLLHVFCTNTMTHSITHEGPDETITRSKLRLETIFFTTKHGSNIEQQQRLTLETKRSVQQLKFVFAQDIKRKNCLSFSLKTSGTKTEIWININQ